MADESPFVPFVPKAALAAAAHRREFIEFCRTRLTTFGVGLPFDLPSWDLSGFYTSRGNINQRTFLHFTVVSNKDSAGESGRLGAPLPEPLASFAKSYVRYYVARKQSELTPRKVVDAFRMIYLALIDKGLESDIGVVDGFLMDHAIEVCRRKFSKNHVADIGNKEVSPD